MQKQNQERPERTHDKAMYDMESILQVKTENL